MKTLIASTLAVCLLSWLYPADVAANTYRHIYNYSSCEVWLGADTRRGNMYCCNRKNYFGVSAHTTEEYELTTTQKVSKGNYYLYSGGKEKRMTTTTYCFGDGVVGTIGPGCSFDRNYYCKKRTFELVIEGCGKIKGEQNTPACGDLTLTDAK